MPYRDSPAILRPSTAEQAFAWFHRIIAGYCLLFGSLYWVRLIGYYDGPLWRFDLMPVHWQIAATILAVIYPFAGIGLWMLTSWGPVIWVVCAIVETAMYAGFPDLFGAKTTVVVSHALVAILYAAFRFVLYWQRRRTAS
ncbi:MAG: DUF6163 family protein [Mesorhizobium sp.]|nr:DUF6163 family protein [Mesorhizobium sp.]